MIKQFKNEYLEKIMEIWLITNIEAHNFIEKSYWLSNYDNVKKMIVESTIFVYEQNNEIIAFIGMNSNFIEGIFVMKKYQSLGIGKKLLDYVKDINTDLFLNVYNKNKRAITFYLRENFTIESENLDKNTGLTEYLMKWSK